MSKRTLPADIGIGRLSDPERTGETISCYPGERCGLFLDGANFCHTAKRLGIVIDFRRLLSFFRSQSRLVTARYYSMLFVDENEHCSLRPLIDWLDFNGFTTVTSEVRRPSRLSEERGEDRERVAVELAVDALMLSDSLDHFIIFAGDSCYAPLVTALQQKGKRVTLVSSLQVTPAPVSDELRRATETFVDLQSLASLVGSKTSRVTTD